MKSSKLSLLSLLLAVGTGTMSPDQAKATLDGMQDKDLRSAHSFVNALGGKQPLTCSQQLNAFCSFKIRHKITPFQLIIIILKRENINSKCLFSALYTIS